MLVAWSRGEAEIRPPRIGEKFTVELQLPVIGFGQRALQFNTKVVRVFEQPNGGVMAGLESTQRRIKVIKPAAWRRAVLGLVN